MTETPKEKYKQFRNYMTNELGITRQDIEAWTKQSVATEVEKKIGQINLDKLVQRAVDDYVRCQISGSTYSTNGQALRRDLAIELAKQISLSFKNDEA